MTLGIGDIVCHQAATDGDFAVYPRGNRSIIITPTDVLMVIAKSTGNNLCRESKYDYLLLLRSTIVCVAINYLDQSFIRIQQCQR